MKNNKLFIFLLNQTGDSIIIYSKNKMKAIEIFENKYPKLFNQNFTITEPSIIIDEHGNQLVDEEDNEK